MRRARAALAAYFLSASVCIKNPRMFLAFGEYTQHTIPCMDTSCIRKESASSLIQTLLSVMESHHISHFVPALHAPKQKAGRGLYRR